VAQRAEDRPQHAKLPGHHGERQCFGQVTKKQMFFMRIFVFQAVNDLRVRDLLECAVAAYFYILPLTTTGGLLPTK
jgi:hypothetical protein